MMFSLGWFVAGFFAGAVLTALGALALAAHEFVERDGNLNQGVKGCRS